MARRKVDRGSSARAKLVTAVAAVSFIFWAGHDPAGAATLLRHIGTGIAAAVHGVAEHEQARS
jgi:GH24 family phage-related lysozyme (muramidase)